MPKIVKLGVVGCGSVAQRGTLTHLAQSDVKDKVQLVAVMDMVSERAKASMEKFGAKEWYDDYDKMLAEADIDAVTICTPIGLHFGQAMKAIAAGKHVHVNKTMTTRTEEADKLIEAADKRNMKLVSSPENSARALATRRAKELIKEGYLGKVYWACVGFIYRGHELESFRTPEYYMSTDKPQAFVPKDFLPLDVRVGKQESVLERVDPTWYYKAEGGGPMFDVGVYCLHQITALFGPAKKVTAFSGIALKERTYMDKKIPVEMDDNTLLLLDFGEATYAFLWAAFCPGPGPFHPTDLFITGSEGSINVPKGWLSADSLELSSYKLPERQRVEKIAYRGYHPLSYINEAHRQMPEAHVFNDVMHLVDCIINDAEPIVVDNVLSAYHARHVIEIMEKGYVAARTGRTQSLATAF